MKTAPTTALARFRPGRPRVGRSLAPLGLALAGALTGTLAGCADKTSTPVGGAGANLAGAGGSGAAAAVDPSGPSPETTDAGSGTPAAADTNAGAGQGAAPAEAQSSDSPPIGPAPVLGYRVVAEFPHDRRAFTQGLLFVDGQLYESTGRNGASSVRQVDLATGELLQNRRLSSNYFGEGLAAVGDRLIQLTWMHQRAFVYDRNTFEKVGELPYQGQGWGLTFDGERLIRTDGSARLFFHHPETFAPLGNIVVTDDGGPVSLLNELEYIDGEVWANVWQTDRIARIDPATGRVAAWVDLSGLIDLPPVLQNGEPQNVLNGIAWEPRSERLFVTGKYWPKLFQIEIVE